MINISKKAHQVARANDFYIEHGAYTPEDGSYEDATTIDISEENSDLFIVYVQNSTGNFDLLMRPDYVTGLPDTITSTRQLTKTLEYIVDKYAG
jgi:hypothetical protein